MLHLNHPYSEVSYDTVPLLLQNPHSAVNNARLKVSDLVGSLDAYLSMFVIISPSLIIASQVRTVLGRNLEEFVENTHRTWQIFIREPSRQLLKYALNSFSIVHISTIARELFDQYVTTVWETCQIDAGEEMSFGRVLSETRSLPSSLNWSLISSR
jgi:hypothetical protein